MANPNAELVDQPLPGAKPDIKGAEGGSLSNPNEEANALTPFYVRTGIGLSFVTTVDYPTLASAETCRCNLALPPD